MGYGLREQECGWIDSACRVVDFVVTAVRRARAGQGARERFSEALAGLRRPDPDPRLCGCDSCRSLRKEYTHTAYGLCLNCRRLHRGGDPCLPRPTSPLEEALNRSAEHQDSPLENVFGGAALPPRPASAMSQAPTQSDGLWGTPFVTGGSFYHDPAKVLRFGPIKHCQCRSCVDARASTRETVIPVVYIAGPYRAGNNWAIEQNVRRAEALSLATWRAGAAAICPHTISRFFQGAAADSVWLQGDLALLRRCDAVRVVEGWEQSTGTCAEIRAAKAWGIPVLYDENEWEAWLAEYRRRLNQSAASARSGGPASS